MAVAGDTIENPQSGERVVFKITTEESEGRLLRFDFFLREGAKQPSLHRHMEQESRFEIISGRMGAKLGGGKARIYEPGETLIVPCGTHHQVWNADSGEVHALVDFEPAGNFEQFLETAFGLMRDGKMQGHGAIPRPILHVALLSSANELYISALPLFLQRPAIALMARLARMRGYRLDYPEYSGGDGKAAPAA
jgi:mannose-6-phosphate isomerase-like protein (cupin superfamily)